MKRVFRIFTLVGCLTVSGVQADDELPVWTMGYQFFGTQQIEFIHDLPGGQWRLSGISEDAQFTLTDIGVRSHQQGSMDEFNVYVLENAGSAEFTGQISMIEPIQIEAELRVLDGSWTGEFWVQEEDLGVVTRGRTLSGTLELNIFGDWETAGGISISQTEEYQPPLREITFPATVGATWTDAPIIYLYGALAADIVIFGDPYSIDESYTHLISHQLAGETLGRESVNEFLSYGSSLDSGEAATISSYYAAEVEWFTRIVQENFTFPPVVGEGDLQLIGYTLDVTAYQHQYPTNTPAPTSTPTATNTPVPTSTPTMIPPTPSSIPTPPEPTLTPTPTAVPPSPTATATMIPPHFGVILEMPSDYYREGDPFYVKALVGNPGDPLSANFVALLDIGTGDFWFYPSWRHFPPEIDYVWIDVDTGIGEIMVVDEFAWPAVEGALQGIFIHAALLNQSLTEIYGDSIGSAQFGYGP